MHHLYPAVKGDPLCPLGFHPQVRWPTRCKRCFRDYKEHGSRKELDTKSMLRKDDASASTPSLSNWSSSSSRGRDDSRSSADSGFGASSRNSWSSGSTSSASSGSSASSASSTSSNDSDSRSTSADSNRFAQRPASWTSTPDLGKLSESTHGEITTVSFTLPRRRPQPADTGQKPASTPAPAPTSSSRDAADKSNDSFTARRRSGTAAAAPEPTETPKTSSSTTAGRSRKGSASEKTEKEKEKSEKTEKAEAAARQRRVRIQSLKEVHSVEEPTNPEVEFIIQVKSSKKKTPTKNDVTNSLKVPSMKVTSSSSSGTSSDDEEDSDDATSTAGTETTETTLVDRNESELQEQIESLKLDLDNAKSRCDRLEREKSDLLLRRIASIDMPSSRMSSSEATRLQQKINELTTQLEDMRDDKKSLSLRVKEVEQEMESRPDKAATQRAMDDLRSKLLAAETLCEELMDENEDMKRELRDLEEEIEEMQDNFREDQADEYTSLKKELEQTTKNCRILSFKLRKAERKTEALEAEKLELDTKCRQFAGGQTGLEKIEKISKLEHDLSVANEVASRLQKELDETKEKLKEKEEAASKVEATVTRKKAPKLADMSGHLKVSRESLTRGGSQEDPAQLLRDLQDAMEREADLREQLRFAEEEAQTLRKKTARMEDDNESLVLQLKKMATKARSRIKSPSPARMTPEPATEKDEGIAEEDDPAELRLQLELNEQEASVLRRKVDELEKEGDKLKKKVKDLQDKLNAKPAKKLSASSIVTPEPGKGNAVYEQKIKVLEEELSECRMKLIEKERDVERLHAELTLTQKRSKGSIQKSKSLDSGNEQQALDLKRQLQIIEQEANILKSKNQALESENEKLSVENKRLVLLRGAKKPTSDNSTDLKEKVAALETELSEAKNKIKGLQSKEDTENKGGEKDADELKKLKGELSKIESENQKINETLKRLKDESSAAAIKFYKQRTPKKPTDLTSKVQLKKMVEDLETEIGEVLVVLKKSEMEKSKLKTSKTGGDDLSLKETKEKLEGFQKKIESLEKELKQEKEKSEKEKNKLTKDKKSAEDEKKKLEDLSKKLEEEKKNLETQGKKTEDSKKKVEEEYKKLISDKDKLLEEKKKLEEQVTKLNAEKAAATVKQDEMTIFIQRVETLKKELEDEQKQGVELRKKLETAQKAEQEKIKLQKEITDTSSKLAESEKKAKETEEKLKKSERLLTTNKKKVVNLEKELTEEKERAKANENTQQGVAASWLAERDELKQQMTTLQNKVDSQEIALSGKTVLIEQLEANVKEERERATDVSKKAGAVEREEVNALRDELVTTKSRLQELTQTLEKVEAGKKSSEVKFKKQENELMKERDDFEKKASELEMDLQAERKKIERMKITQEKESKNKETELATLRTKLRSLESSSKSGKKTAELQQEYESRIRKLEDELAGERQEYEDLTAKYEILEEEHVVTKAQLVMEKEALQGQLHSTKREMGSVENELRTLRETYNSKQDSWIKEKLDQQEKLKELEEKVSRSINNETLSNEKARSRAAIEEKNVEIEHLRRESEVLADQMNHMKRENDDLKKKMEDFNKVVKIQRNMTADTSALENEVRDMKNKLFQEEKTHKSEMAQLKMRYDSQSAVVGEELQSLQGQVSRFKRERDTFRHMLEGAQKTIADLKASLPSRDSRPSSSASGEEAEDTLTKIATLEQQINCMEDELSEARLESSKLKTELVSERSSWEIKLSELQSRVNELEEERILTSGRTKIPGMRTRMELAWSKEREELQRLLQETSTLARDLRQTLFEVERERDKERLECKRRIDQLKKTTEEEVDENKKKVTELQCDLLELRDAHAKLRTTNEKLRREKERHEKEREELRQMASGKRRAGQDEEKRINSLLDQVDELMRLAPELFQSKQASSDSGVTTPTPPRRTKGPKSRESSPGLERKDYSRETSVDRKVQLQSTVQRLTEATEALRKYQRAGEEDRDRERARRALGMRRAASTESDNPPETLRPLGASSRTPVTKGSLHRKALSLEQTSAQEQQSIWKTDDEGDGSLSSLQSVGSTDSRFYSLNRRDNSMDSRLSGGSTQSEFTSGEKKKKKGILGKLKQLTKSRSIDDTTSSARDYMSSQGSLGGSGSDISMGGDEKGSKKDLRDRLTGMFKKPSSRANSVERGKKEPSPALPERSDSIQRPLVRNGSSSTLPRPSPARSDISTSSVSRPLVPGKSSTPSSTTSTIRRVK